MTTSSVMAGCFGLAAFAVALLAGLGSDNPAGEILMRAMIAMLVCYPLGFLAGMVCERVIGSHAVQQAAVRKAELESAARGSEPGEKPQDGPLLV